MSGRQPGAASRGCSRAPWPRARPLKDPTPAKLGTSAEGRPRLRRPAREKVAASGSWRRALDGRSLSCSAPSLCPPPHRGYAPLQLKGRESLLLGGAGGLGNRAELKVTPRPYFSGCTASAHRRPKVAFGPRTGRGHVWASQEPQSGPGREAGGDARSPEVQPSRAGVPSPHPSSGDAPLRPALTSAATRGRRPEKRVWVRSPSLRVPAAHAHSALSRGGMWPWTWARALETLGAGAAPPRLHGNAHAPPGQTRLGRNPQFNRVIALRHLQCTIS